MSVEFVTVGKASDLPVGAVAAFDVNETRIAIANVAGAFYAFDDMCTHAECSLGEGEMDDIKIICPCHQGSFDVRTGAVIGRPGRFPLKTYLVRTQGDELQVAI